MDCTTLLCVILIKILTVVSGDPVQSESFCVSRPDGLYPDQIDCHRYFHCLRQKSFSLKCLDGFVFDPCRRLCVYQNVCISISECAKSTPASESYKSNANEKGRKEQSKNAIRLILEELGKNKTEEQWNGRLAKFDLLKSGEVNETNAGTDQEHNNTQSNITNIKIMDQENFTNSTRPLSAPSPNSIIVSQNEASPISIRPSVSVAAVHDESPSTAYVSHANTGTVHTEAVPTIFIPTETTLEPAREPTVTPPADYDRTSFTMSTSLPETAPTYIVRIIFNRKGGNSGTTVNTGQTVATASPLRTQPVTTAPTGQGVSTMPNSVRPGLDVSRTPGPDKSEISFSPLLRSETAFQPSSTIPGGLSSEINFSPQVGIVASFPSPFTVTGGLSTEHAPSMVMDNQHSSEMTSDVPRSVSTIGDTQIEVGSRSSENNQQEMTAATALSTESITTETPGLISVASVKQSGQSQVTKENSSHLLRTVNSDFTPKLNFKAGDDDKNAGDPNGITDRSSEQPSFSVASSTICSTCADRPIDPVKTVTSDQRSMDRATTGTRCGALICLNGGMYIELSSGTCGCLCPRGWKGGQCQDLVDRSQCQCANGGRCVTIQNTTYACLCPLGYLGAQCQYQYWLPSE